MPLRVKYSHCYTKISIQNIKYKISIINQYLNAQKATNQCRLQENELRSLK